MTDDELAAIRMLLEDTERARDRLTKLGSAEWNAQRPRAPMVEAARALLAEVYRQREVVRAVADMPLAYSHEAGNYCAFCEASDEDLNIGRGVVTHTPDCPVAKARELLASDSKE